MTHTILMALVLVADPIPKSCPKAVDVPPAGTCSISDAGEPSCAPGDTETDDLDIICHQSTKPRRCKPTPAFKKALLKAYGVESAGEIDHRISLELGGSNSAKNLWPQPADEFKLKDWVENELHRRVCSNKMTLQEARTTLLRSWRVFYEANHPKGPSDADVMVPQ